MELRLLQPGAIEAHGEVRCAGVAEVNWPGAYLIGGQRDPVQQVSRGFDDHDLSGQPRQVEPELLEAEFIRAETEVAVVGENYRWSLRQ